MPTTQVAPDSKNRFITFSWPTGLTVAFERAAFRDSNVIKVGISFTHPKDRFSRSKGKLIATNRVSDLDMCRGTYVVLKDEIIGKDAKTDRTRLLKALMREMGSRSTTYTKWGSLDRDSDFNNKAQTAVYNTQWAQYKAKAKSKVRPV
jgi:hypothetical protein